MEPVQNDLSKKYSKATMVIHWITALLILILFPVGKYMSGIGVEEKMGLVQFHALGGMLVLVLTIARSWMYFKHERPVDIKTGSKFNDRLAVWIHNAFYFLLFGIALSGSATMVLGGYTDALNTGNPSLILPSGDVKPLAGHEIMAMILMVLFLMHVVGVIKHYVVMKENTLKRIFPGI